MPWLPRDARRFNKGADTESKKRAWAETANAVLEDTGDEGKAVRTANSVLKKKQPKTRKRKT